MKLYEVAKSYIGTPHHNGGNVKGAGLDCCTLVTSIYREIGLADIPVNFGYSGDWYCRCNCEELMLPYLEKYFSRVDILNPGDVVSYAWGRSKYAHLSLYLEQGQVIHCSADDGTVITDFNDPVFFDARGNSRVTGFWRLKHGIF